MKYFKLIAISAILLVIFSCCKKDDEIPHSPGNAGDGVTHFSKATLDYCFFKPGTWWVYVDSLSGTRDSVYVTSSSLNNDTVTEEDNVGYTGIFERFYIYTSCTYLGFTQKQYSHMAYFLYSQPGYEEVYYYRWRPGFSSGDETLFLTKLQNGYTNGDYPGLCTSLGVYDSARVGNTWFHNVAPFYNNENEAEYGKNTFMYLAKGIGLVKKVIPDSSRNWILVNYNIVQ